MIWRAGRTSSFHRIPDCRAEGQGLPKRRNGRDDHVPKRGGPVYPCRQRPTDQELNTDAGEHREGDHPAPTMREG